MLLKELIQKGISTISTLYPEVEAREMVLVYLQDTIGIKRHTHIIEPEYEVADEKAAEVFQAFERLAEGEPLQYVTGAAHFYGRCFHVTPATLIPRPETELLCRMAVEAAARPASRVLDLCTGSGCIAWTLALELPQSDVVAVDLSEDALEVALGQDFAEEMQLTGAHAPTFVNADVLDSDLLSAMKHLCGQGEIPSNGKFDIILSNPPYVMDSEKAMMRKNVLDHEPHMALFVPDSDPLLFYRAVADRAAELLAPDGTGVVEINEALGEETANVFRARGFAKAEVVKDLYDKDRFVRFAWK